MYLFFDFILILVGAALGTVVQPLPDLAGRQTKLFFCHFMIGIVSDRTSAADYDADMRRAKAYGIDAFALNIGTDGYTDQQLNYAYDSAAANDMKVFISFDFNWWSASNAAGVGSKVAQYGSRPAQLKVDGEVFVSSFAGDGLGVAVTGIALYVVPNSHPGQLQGDFLTVGSIGQSRNYSILL